MLITVGEKEMFAFLEMINIEVNAPPKLDRKREITHKQSLTIVM